MASRKRDFRPCPLPRVFDNPPQNTYFLAPTENSEPPMTFLLLRLSSIRDTAASSTHRLLADLIRSAAPDADIDFAFLPPERAPHVTGLFSGRPLAAFDLVLVTNAFVQEAVNLPWLLHANGLSPWASERPSDVPPVLLGGSNAFAAQCLARPDGTAVPDAFFFGEAEESLPRFITRWTAAATSDKHTRLRYAADGLDGFWVTGALPAAPIPQAVSRTLPPPPAVLPLTDTDASGTVRLTVGLGCAAFCSFCFEGYERKPYRELAVADALRHARDLKRACGARTVELDAFNLNAYAGLGTLVPQLARLFDRLAFKSQRADGLARCPELIDLERAAGKSTYTLGIEGISPRMRAFLSKSLSDADISAAVKALLDRRVREIKLFFILTAHETPEDLAAFSDFCLRLKSWLAAPHACTRVILSFGRLVRMPNTPLAHDRLFLDEAEWRFSVDGVAAACRRAQLECRFAFDWPDYLGTQLLAACRHEHADAVVSLACRGLSHHGPWTAREAALVRAAIPLEASAPAARAFPFVRRTVSDAFLRQRWDAARQFLDGGYCLGDACLGCGACTDAAERDALTGHPMTPQVTPETVAAVAQAEAEKRRLPPLLLHAVLPPECAGRSPAWVSAHLMQTLLTCAPDLTENLLAIEEALFSDPQNSDKLPIPAGQTLLRLKAWQPDKLAVLWETSIADGLKLAPTPPGTAVRFSQASWAIRTRLPPREAAQHCGTWLNALHLPHTLRRDGDIWRADLAPAALKKKCVFTLAAHPEENGTRVDIRFAPKAPLLDLLPRLPPAPPRPHVWSESFQP